MSTSELTDQRILLTGGAGFVGSHLSKRLLAEGNDVLIVDDLSNGRREWVPDGVGFVEGDLTEPSTVRDFNDEDLEYVFPLSVRLGTFDRKRPCSGASYGGTRSGINFDLTGSIRM